MDLGLNGRTAIVCGASQGMGLAIAEAFAREGMNVAMFARRRRVLETEAERLGGKQPDASAKPTRPRSAPPSRRVIPVQGDVTNPQDCERLVGRAIEAFGGIDVLVNNSGGPPRGSALEVDEESLEAAVALLLTSAVRLTNLCLPHLRKSPAGRIVNIESSTVREPADNLALSNAVRPGVVGWAKTLSREIGPEGITVNTIAPGRIDTERLKEVYPDGPSEEDLKPIPLRRLGRPDEIAAVVCFLASDAGSYVTGTVIAVDGGLTRGLL